MAGMEGHALYLLTRFGTPTSWSAEEVPVYLSKVRKELQSGGFPTCFVYRRVWAQKPFDSEPKTEQKEIEVEKLA